MPPADDKKKEPPKPECVPPAEAQPPDDMSPEFYLNQIAQLELCVERSDMYSLSSTGFVTIVHTYEIRCRPSSSF